MSTLLIRPATLDDLETLYRFEQGIILAERPYDPTLVKDPINYYDLKKYVSETETEVVVAVIDDVIVASAYAQIREAKDYLDHQLYAYLGFMFVEPEHRGKSINGAIIESLEKWIKRQGVSEVRLDVYADNNSALSAYNKKGFKPHMLTMRKRI